MKNALRMLRRAFRRRQSDIVRVMCPDCLDMVNPYAKHNCVIVEAVETICK